MRGFDLDDRPSSWGDSWKDIVVNPHKVRQTVVNNDDAAHVSSSLTLAHNCSSGCGYGSCPLR